MGRSALRATFRAVLVCGAFFVASAVSALDLNKSGEPSAVKTFGLWTLYCKESPVDVSDCALAQAAQSQTNSDIKFAISISFDALWNPRFKLRMEPKLVKTEGIALLVDGSQRGFVLPSSCDAKGCEATFVPPSNMLARILHGKELEAEFRLESSVNGTSIALDLSDLVNGLAEMAKSFDSYVYIASAGPQDFKINLISIKDLPKNEIIGIDAVKNALSVSSALIACARGAGAVSAEHRPKTVNISVNGKIEFVDGKNKVEAENGLHQLADITRNCGKEYFVAVIPEYQDLSRGQSNALFEIQQAAVENVVADHGVSRSKLLVPDYRAGFVVNKSQDLFGMSLGD